MWTDEQAVRRAMRYIAGALDGPLTVADIAAQAGYSPFHFCRMFRGAAGMPVMDYVRLQRLTAARGRLLRGEKAIDAALACGFETASGFSRAFRRAFGYSPTTYLARMKALPGGAGGRKGGDRMEPVMKTLGEFWVAGYGIDTNVERGYTKDIAAYWETYTGENMESRMYARLSPPRHGEVGLCVPGGGWNLTYLFGVMPETLDALAPDMRAVRVPAAQYAVFTTKPVDLPPGGVPAGAPDPLAEAVRALWGYIFEQWLPAGEWEYDPAGLDFEFYDERCHGSSGLVMDIYVPVKRRGT